MTGVTATSPSRRRKTLTTGVALSEVLLDAVSAPHDLRRFTYPQLEELAAEIKKPSKSLHRMLAPRGNPSTENFFGIVNALQKKTRVKLRVTAKAS